MSPIAQTSAATVRFLFTIVFALFLLAGFVLVLTQIIGLIITNPALVTGTAELLNAPAVMLASLGGILAFLHTYLARKPAADPDEDEE